MKNWGDIKSLSSLQFNVAPVLKQLFMYTSLGNQYADYTCYLYGFQAAV